MMLTRLTAVPGTALPVAALREQLRLGTGFADDGGQDDLLERYLRAAIAAVEARISKVLLQHALRLRLQGWRDPQRLSLPLAPVQAVQALRLIMADGSAVAVDPADYRLVPDLHRPTICATRALLPAVPWGGAVEIDFEAGFGPDWADVPVDLAQAVLLLAAQYHEARSELAAGGVRGAAMPFGVMALIERWRGLRIGAGA